MTITLTPELEEVIRERVKSGAYKSASDVIKTSLRLLRAQEQGEDALRRELMRGVEDVENGRYTSFGGLARPVIVVEDLAAAYALMAADEAREAEAREWSDALVGDMADDGH